MTVAIELDWQPAGEVVLDAEGRLSFPLLATDPGVYRFRLVSESTSSYIGEAQNLRRRAAGYRGGYAGQRTNARMSGRMHEHLVSGGRIEVSIATAGRLTIDGVPRRLDLGRKAARLLAESAALQAVPVGELIENLPGIGDGPEH